jgi:hypothetical protein
VVQGAVLLKPGPAWQSFRLLVLVLILLGMAEAAANLIRPIAGRLRPLPDLFYTAGFVVAYVVLRTGDLFVAGDGSVGLPGMDPRGLAEVVNSSMLYGVLVAMLITILVNGVALVHYLRRRMRHSRTPALVL